MRHSIWLESLLAYEWRGGSRQWIWRLIRPHSMEWLRTRHPDAAGSVVQSCAVVLLSAHWVAIAASVTALPVIGYLIARMTDSRKFVEIDIQGFTREGLKFIPRLRPIGRGLLAAGVASAVSAVLSRERPIFYGDSPTAVATLATLGQIVATVGVLAITLSFVLAQVAASEVSIRSSLRLARHPFLYRTAVVLITSLALTMALLTQAYELPQAPDRALWWPLDVALLLGALSLATTGWFVWQAPALLGPEPFVALELRRFTKWWSKQITDDWGGRRYPRTLWNERDDPLVVLERVLYKAIQNRDGLTIQTTLYQLAERIQDYFPRDPDRYDTGPGGVILNFQQGGRPEIAALDAYLFERFADVIDLAADQHYTFALDHLTDFWARVGPGRTSDQLSWVSKARFGPPDRAGTPGQQFIRRIVESGIRTQNAEAAERALQLIFRANRELAHDLPRGTDLWDIYLNAHPDQRPRGGPEPVIDEQDRTRRQGNDEKVRSFTQIAVEYCQAIGLEAISFGLWEVVSDCTVELQFIVGAVFDETGDKALRSHVLWHVLSSLSRISDRLCQIPDGQKSAVANSFIFMLSFLRTPLERLDANTDEGMAKWMGDGLSQLIATQLAAGVLSVTLIHDAAELVVADLHAFATVQADFIRTLADAARTISAEGWTAAEPHKREIYRAFLSALCSQIPTDTRSWTVEELRQVRFNVDSAMRGLGEAIVGPWQVPKVPLERRPLKGPGSVGRVQVRPRGRVRRRARPRI